MNNIDKLVGYLYQTICSKEGYSGIFKGGVALISFAMLSLSQYGPFLYEKDIEAYKEKYTLEEKLQIKITEKIDCSKQKKSQAKCEVIKHKLFALKASLMLLETLFNNAFWLVLYLCGISAVGFLLRPFIEKN